MTDLSLTGQICCLDLSKQDMDGLRLAIILLTINQVCQLLTHAHSVWTTLPSLKQVLGLALLIGLATGGYHAYTASHELQGKLMQVYVWAMRTVQRVVLQSPILSTSTAILPTASASWLPSWLKGVHNEL
jgi:hypothetical protein